jgi:hypothetical protein
MKIPRLLTKSMLRSLQVVITYAPRIFAIWITAPCHWIRLRAQYHTIRREREIIQTEPNPPAPACTSTRCPAQQSEQMQQYIRIHIKRNIYICIHSHSRHTRTRTDVGGLTALVRREGHQRSASCLFPTHTIGFTCDILDHMSHKGIDCCETEAEKLCEEGESAQLRVF